MSHDQTALTSQLATSLERLLSGWDSEIRSEYGTGSSDNETVRKRLQEANHAREALAAFYAAQLATPTHKCDGCGKTFSGETAATDPNVLLCFECLGRYHKRRLQQHAAEHARLDLLSRTGKVRVDREPGGCLEELLRPIIAQEQNSAPTTEQPSDKPPVAAGAAEQ